VFMGHRAADRLQYSANALAFTGRLIDISGEVVATLNMVLPANYVLPRTYQVQLMPKETTWDVVGQNYEYLSPYWITRAQSMAEERLVESVVNLLIPKQ